MAKTEDEVEGKDTDKHVDVLTTPARVQSAKSEFKFVFEYSQIAVQNRKTPSTAIRFCL